MMYCVLSVHLNARTAVPVFTRASESIRLNMQQHISLISYLILDNKTWLSDTKYSCGASDC